MEDIADVEVAERCSNLGVVSLRASRLLGGLSWGGVPAVDLELGVAREDLEHDVEAIMIGEVAEARLPMDIRRRCLPEAL